jgi:putative Ca2+/H+ antiporter (TMEM165/GDT1 family)
MEALVPAFLLALLSQIGDRPPLLAAILSDRYRRPVTILLAALCAHAAGNIIAAAVGATLTATLTPEAKSLLLAVALLFGGVTGLWATRLPSRLDRWRLGAFATSLAGLFILALGERTQFMTFALSTAGHPWLAAAGATIGATIISAPAAMLGESRWSALSLRPVRIAIAALFLCAGIIIGVGALRLV